MRAVFLVIVGGVDVTSRFAARLDSVRVTDRAGQTTDSATIVLDDRDGEIIMPEPEAEVEVWLGWEDRGAGLVFRGVVDDIRASGSRGGRLLHLTAKGMDTRGPAKEPQRLHLDDTTIVEAMEKAGDAAGFSVRVDPDLAGIARRYIALDDESFAAFGERIAREVGGTFKIAAGRAILAKRGGGTSASGGPLPTIRAAWGDNLHSYDVAPILGRPVEARTAVRFYDPAAAAWRIAEAETGTPRARTIKVAMMHVADQETAQTQARADAEEADRRSGEGTVVIEGNIDAQPEGLCVVSGCRPGVDGLYRIEGVDHEYSRAGFLTSLELRQPQGAAGEDDRE